MKKPSFIFAVAAVTMPLAIVSTAFSAQARPIYIDEAKSAAAVGGYDVVSYFSGDGVPVKGNKEYSVKHDGADYYFSSRSNANKFKKDPAAYAPQYGGHCAWAMSRGSLAPGDPTVYKVVDGKLYLNFNTAVQKKWLLDIPGFILKADAAWSKIPDDAKFGG